MAQGGLHRGVVVCKGAPGLPVALPVPGPNPLPAPQPLTPCVSAQVHHGMVAVREDMGG